MGKHIRARDRVARYCAHGKTLSRVRARVNGIARARAATRSDVVAPEEGEETRMKITNRRRQRRRRHQRRRRSCARPLIECFFHDRGNACTFNVDKRRQYRAYALTKFCAGEAKDLADSVITCVTMSEAGSRVTIGVRSIFINTFPRTYYSYLSY